MTLRSSERNFAYAPVAAVQAQTVVPRPAPAASPVGALRRAAESSASVPAMAPAYLAEGHAQAPAPLPYAQPPAPALLSGWARPQAWAPSAGHAPQSFAPTMPLPAAYMTNVAPWAPGFAPQAAPYGVPAQPSVNDLRRAVARTRASMNEALNKHPVAKHAGRAVTVMATLGAIGAGVGVGAAVLTGAFGALSGIGLPVAAAALGGVTIGVAGIAPGRLGRRPHKGAGAPSAKKRPGAQSPDRRA